MKTRQPLEMLLIPEETLATFSQRMAKIIEEQSNVLGLRGVSERQEEKLVKFEVKGRTALMGPKYREKTGRIIQAIASIEPHRLIEELKEKKKIAVTIEGEEIEVLEEELEVSEEAVEPYSMGKVGQKKIFLNVKLSHDLLDLGIVRDLVRVIQEMRKRMNLEMMEIVDLTLETEKKIIDATHTHLDYIKREARIDEVIFNKEISAHYVEEWEVSGTPVKIGIMRHGR